MCEGHRKVGDSCVCVRGAGRWVTVVCVRGTGRWVTVVCVEGRRKVGDSCVCRGAQEGG